MYKYKQQAGVTIVELMVALVLGLILMGGVLQIYLSTKRTHDVTEGLSRLQESTRFSLDMMARDIRMAGYIPCGRPQTTATVVSNADTFWWADIFNQPIQGFDGESTVVPGGVALTNRVAGSDALLVLRGGSKVAAAASYDSANSRFIMQRELGADWIEDGDLMVACDPRHAAFFQVGNYTNGNPSTLQVSASGNLPGNCTSDLGFPAPAPCASPTSGSPHSFGDDTQLVDYKAVIYYVADSITGNGGHSLFRRYLLVNSSNNIAESNPEELLEGVDNMQLLYGVDVDTDDIADRYVQADDVTDWGNVVTVRIGLLLASEDGLRSGQDFDDQVYKVANTDIGITGPVTHAQDRRKRYVSSTTVSIRNP